MSDEPPTQEQWQDSDGWCTPQWLADELGEFDLDPCSNERSHVHAAHRVALPDNGLDDFTANGYLGSVYVNPPYSDVMPWAKKLVEHRGPWCALLKLDPTTKWYALLADSGAVITPFRKRIAFERPDKPPLTANFPSVLVWANGWRPSTTLANKLWMPKPDTTMLRRVLELVDRGAFMTHARQLVLREAEALVKL